MLYTPAFLRMSLANLFTVTSFGTFFLFPLFIIRHGGSEADTGIIMGAFALSSVLSRPWVSDMVDRLGRKRSYTLGCLIMSILPLAYLLFQGDLKDFYLPLLLVRIIHGIGLAICFTAAFTYVADITPEDRLTEGIGMFGVTGLTGMAAGPALAELIIRLYGFSVCFVCASCMAVGGLIAHLQVPESYVRQARTSSRSFFSVLKRGKTLTVALVAMLFGVGLSASGTFVSPFAAEKQMAFISLYYLSYSSAAILTRLIAGRLADRVGEERVIPYALMVAGAGLLLLLLPGGIPMLAISGFMTGCGHGFIFPCLNSVAIRYEPVQIRGKVTGIFTGSIDMGTFAGSIILGYVGAWAGFQTLFFVAALAFFMGFGLLKIPAVAATWQNRESAPKKQRSAIRGQRSA